MRLIFYLNTKFNLAALSSAFVLLP